MIYAEYSGYGFSLKSITKSISKAIKPVTRFVTRAAPAAIGGLLVAGPAGAIAGAATGFIGGKNKPLKRLMYGLGAGSIVSAATPALMKAFPKSQLVANIATNVYSSPIGAKLADLTYNMAFKNATSMATQAALAQGNIDALPNTEKDKLATALQLAAIAQSQGLPEQRIAQSLDTYFKTGSVEQAIQAGGISTELEKPVTAPAKAGISTSSLMLIGGAVLIPVLIFVLSKRR